MNHFDIVQWTDYVRTPMTEEMRLAMDQHLLKCKTCAATVAWLRHVADTAAEEPALEPPAELVAAAERVFPVAPPPYRTTWEALRLLSVQLVVDTLRDPAPAGARQGFVSSHHVLYEADRYSIDPPV